MLWSILIASHSSRVAHLARLAASIAPQLTPNVEVVVLWNRGGEPLGKYRDRLLEEARGEYVCFVDDDDRIPDYYVTEILAALETAPDYVGFRVAFTDTSERPMSRSFRLGVAYPAVHSLKNKKWFQEGTTFYRDVSHLNPIRRSIALQGSFMGEHAEDVNWAKTVRGVPQSEVFIDRTMYFYDYCLQESIRSGGEHAGGDRPSLPEGFRYHPDSKE